MSMALALEGRRIVIPETREGEVLAGMLERHGATVVRCPLVAIRDADDPAPVVAWLRRFAAAPPDDLILFTGEGLRRLGKLAEAQGLAAPFTAALARVRKITRGPKPARRLRELGLKPDLPVGPPTTAGIIAALSGEDLRSRRIGVQFYPEAPPDLGDFLTAAGAVVDPVLPYAYASAADEERVAAVIRAMAAGEVDLIAFTSQPQLRRLRAVARTRGCEPLLADGFAKTKIAAVGPVVAAAVEAAGATVAIVPAANFHMRPMVNAIVAALDRAE
ncbi:MAG TPA: uroporphyrinogen-III synthase [Stellaceae bacterium]|nr:uroporphyrinogen-III synthase [Stellaceae bacterium]